MASRRIAPSAAIPIVSRSILCLRDNKRRCMIRNDAPVDKPGEAPVAEKPAAAPVREAPVAKKPAAAVQSFWSTPSGDALMDLGKVVWVILLVVAMGTFGVFMCMGILDDVAKQEAAAADKVRQDQAAALDKRKEGMPKRLQMANAWLVENAIDGHLTCWPNVEGCEVVPKDTRPPIRLLCVTSAEKCQIDWRR